MKPTELLDLYNSHQFYLQLSTSEGFPNALGEAMTCGCIPIGSAVGAIPEIIGDSGIVLAKKELNLLENQIFKLLNQNLAAFSNEAYQRILKLFNFEKRKKALLKVLNVFVLN
jgi:glycosyltransferase involved in cell wall biosynthesis